MVWPSRTDMPRGAFVNLGIGRPTAVADHLTVDSGVVLRAEDGVLHMGPTVVGDEIDPNLTNAGKVPAAELPGAAYFDSAQSLAMMRDEVIPAEGGAMDRAIGARQVMVMRSLFAKDGRPKLVERAPTPSPDWPV